MARDTLVTGSKLTALANSIREKADISDSLTLDGMKTAVDNIQTGGDLELVKKLIERPSNTDLVIPEGVTKIGEGTFCNYTGLSSVTIPNSLQSIESSAFASTGLTSISIPPSIRSVGYNCFSFCSKLVHADLNCNDIGNTVFSSCDNLERISLGKNVSIIGDRLAAACPKLSTINFPNSITSIYTGMGIAYNCPNLEYVTIENGFNANGLNLATSNSTKFSVETIVSWLNALADRTGQTAYTLTIGSTNLAKLTSDQIAIATNKNWNLA